MNIGMISLYLPSEDKIGSGYQAHYMANALTRRGHRVMMFSPAARPEDAAYEHTRVETGRPLRTFRFAWRLRRVDWKAFDVLHAHGDDYWLWTRKHPVHIRTMHGSCLAEALHVPGFKEKFRMLTLGFSEILATAAADATVCVSENTRRNYPWVRRVIGNGVDTAAFAPSPRSPTGDGKEEDPTILFVGTYANRKRGKLLMDAFAGTIRPAIPNARLWMVCADAPAAPGVEALGRLSTPELAARYRRAWVFCLPSSYEGFGVPYIEAMASGTAVVATPNVGAREVLDNGKFGLIVEPGALGRAIVSLLQSPEERERWRAAGLERSRQYSWDTIAARYEALYEELAGGGASAREPSVFARSNGRAPTRDIEPPAEPGADVVSAGGPEKAGRAR